MTDYVTYVHNSAESEVTAAFFCRCWTMYPYHNSIIIIINEIL